MRIALALGLLPLLAGASAALEITETDDGWSVLDGERVAFSLHYSGEYPKPFVDPLTTPGGHSVTLVSPADHVHHRGLMFAWGNVRPMSEPEDYHLIFWGEEGDPSVIGRIIPAPDKEPIIDVDDGRASIVTFTEWRRNSDDLLVLTERCELAYEDGILTWVTEQTAQVDLVIGPTPGRDVSYYGLGIRVPADMDRGMFVNSNGSLDVAGCDGDDAKWTAYAAEAQPPRGFAMLDHPDNPRFPTGWFAMNDFGYLTASLVAHEPFPELKAGETLRLRYGVVAFDGGLDAEAMEEQYEDWLEQGD